MNCKNKIDWIPDNKIDFDRISVEYQSEFLEL